MSLPPKRFSAVSTPSLVSVLLCIITSLLDAPTYTSRDIFFSFKGLNETVLSQVQHDLCSLGPIGIMFSMFLKGLRAPARSLSVSWEQSEDASHCFPLPLTCKFPLPLTCKPDYFPYPLSLHII